jgi:hypothetical protein
VCGSKLDEIGNADLSLGGNIGEVAAKALQAAILNVRALVGENKRSVASSVKAVVEGRSDSSASSICALAISEELLGEGGRDLSPNSRTFLRGFLVAAEEATKQTEDLS